MTSPKAGVHLAPFGNFGHVTDWVFDLDNTLCTAPRRKGDYSTCEPVSHTIAYLKQVKVCKLIDSF